MKVVILAGGLGTRISEESHLKPKPMIEIGDAPILWHIMKYYSSYGYNEFIICCGYKGYVIKEYFADYYLHSSDVTFDFSDNNRMIIHNNVAEPWKVTLVDTGTYTETGGRIRKIKRYLDNGTFMMTYGDGISNVDLDALAKFHKTHDRLATITAIQPGGRFGVLDMDNSTGSVYDFREKAKGDGGWINAGFMMLEPGILDYIKGDYILFEREPMVNLAKDGQLMAFQHHGFWQCMDTLRDKKLLESLWGNGQAPWKRW
ncbi:glucose-1-phosphate cytidylyltransferase [Lachnospiraceae bacterium]|nr:glucose-1-phosphate cytidylyltransferase [Lachnospiraceae bacterium]